MSAPGTRKRGWNGLAVIGGLVLLGLTTGSFYFRYKAPRLRAEFEARLAEAPTTAAGRLEYWHEFGAAQIHHKLTKLPPRIEGHAWLVTYAIESPAGDPELWGIDLERLPQKLSHLEELNVVIELPPPRALGRASLTGDAGRHVPVYAPGAPIPDQAERVRSLVMWFLEGLAGALERDIEGARLIVRLTGSELPLDATDPDDR